ncbi:hypothetical protein RB201_38045 [Streptomyces sp. S1A(2023)]
MSDVVEYHGVPVLVCDATGVTIADVQDALDHLIGAAFACVRRWSLCRPRGWTTASST